VICARLTLPQALFALAGTMTLLAIVLGVVVSPWLLLLGVFVAANQWLFALVGACPASLVLGRTSCFSGEVTR
jgi:hypothetical protein